MMVLIPGLNFDPFFFQFLFFREKGLEWIIKEFKKLGQIDVKSLLPEFLDNQAKEFLLKVFIMSHKFKMQKKKRKVTMKKKFQNNM